MANLWRFRPNHFVTPNVAHGSCVFRDPRAYYEYSFDLVYTKIDNQMLIARNSSLLPHSPAFPALFFFFPFLHYPSTVQTSVMFEFLFRPSVSVPLLFLLAYTLYGRISSKQNRPDITWVGLRKEWFAETRCRWPFSDEVNQASSVSMRSSTQLLWRS